MEQYGFHADRPPRPVVAALLAVLYAALATMFVLVLTEWDDAMQILGRVEAQTSMGYLVTGAMALLAAGAAVGLFLGFFWGWWLAGVLALELALQHALVLVAIPDLQQHFGREGSAVEYFILEHLGRSVGWFLVVVVLHIPGLVDFFHLYELPRRRNLLIQTVVAAGLVFVTALAFAL